MDVGTAELINENEEPKRRRSGFSSGSSPSSGGRNKGGGGSDGPDDHPDGEPTAFRPEKARILTGFLLLVVLMTFGGMIGAYVVIATNKAAEWQPFALPIPVWISTALILLSSITYVISERATIINDQPKAKKWMIVTTVLGAFFISSQILAWIQLTRRGLYMEGNPYAGFFYILTAVHAVHVIGGISALSSILLKSWYPAGSETDVLRRISLAKVVGWYWHFMGLLWLVLLFMLGFWK
ncbi:MAG: cytochrome c oxidase subunit 3 [Pyrinomonadaceae bacterium]|nr:cytochrome c oxidase subunit 3 [Acidobacteriota bacterium]MBP7416488.1 cytochrome c oxidase subunit 3 [Pyrinomonadaceae bacterium]